MTSQTPLKYKVAINCLVYNHEPYLRDCLEGFVMQQTDFPFVAIVHDDASTDHSADIIREYAEKYPDIIRPIYETENQCSKSDGSLTKIMDDAIDATGAKYVAMCEGDDYWTDPLKLQKQVDILETDETLSICCTACAVVDNNKNIIEEKRYLPVVKNNREGKYNLRDFFAQAHQYPTASVVYRCSHSCEVRKKVEVMRNPYMGDWPLWIALLCFGDSYYLDQVTMSYRINPTSVTNTNAKVRGLGLAKENFKLIPAVASVLPVQYCDVRENLLSDNAWMWYRLAVAYKKNKYYVRMIYCLIRCELKSPLFIYRTLYGK